MFPIRNNLAFRGQASNFANGFRFQQGSPFPYGAPGPMGWFPMAPISQSMGMQDRFQRQMAPRQMRPQGMKRHMPYKDTHPSKKARTSDSEDSNDVIEMRYKVPVSHGTEKITVAIWEYFLRAQMTDEHLKKKLKLRQCLHNVFEGAFPGCRLFIVGSSMTGFATKKSDADMCLMMSEKEINQKGDGTYILSVICKALRRCSFIQTAQVIRAKVPILKFNDYIADVECDLNINNTVGIRNTHLLRHYAYMDWRVRPLMLFIKHWARFHDINDASKRTISSYSFSLMLIHYLQDGVEPPVLPCLQKMAADVFSQNRDVRNLSLSMDDKVEFTSENAACLGELFMGFLNYYANVFNYDNMISIRLGKSLSCQECREIGVNTTEWKHLRIEEPFDRTNTARSVYDQFTFMRILRVFDVSFKTLQRTRDIESVLSTPF